MNKAKQNSTIPSYIVRPQSSFSDALKQKWQKDVQNERQILKQNVKRNSTKSNLGKYVARGMDWADKNPDFKYGQTHNDPDVQSLGDFMKDMLPSVGSIAAGSLFSGASAASLMSVAQAATSTLGSQMLTSFMQDANTTNATSTSGKIQINNARSESAQAYLDLLQQRDVLNQKMQELDQLQNLYRNNPNNKELLDQIDKTYNDISVLQNITSGDYAKKVEQDYAENLGRSGLDGVWSTLYQGLKNKISDLANASVIPNYGAEQAKQQARKKNEQEAIADYIKDYRQDTYNNLSEEEKKQYNILPKDQQKDYLDRVTASNFIKQNNEANKELMQDYIEDLQDAQDWNRWIPMSKSYKANKQVAQDYSLLDPRYYAYAMPGTMGSSFSSPYQIAAMGTRGAGMLGGAAATYFGHPEVGKGVYNLAELVATGLDTAAGFDENYAEVADRSVDVAKQQLEQSKDSKKILADLRKKSIDFRNKNGLNTKDLSDEDVIKDALSGATNSAHPDFQIAKLASMQGSQAQFWHDNIATMGESFQNYLLQVLPGGSAREIIGASGKLVYNTSKKAGKSILSKIAPDATNTMVKFGKNAEGKLIAAGKRINPTTAVRETRDQLYDNIGERQLGRYAAGKEFGEASAQVLGQGYIGQVAYGKLGGGANMLFGLAKDQIERVLPETATQAVRQAKKSLLFRANKIYDKLIPSLASRDLAKYGFNVAWRHALSSFSEGAEEGRQYINSKEDYAKHGLSYNPLQNLSDLVIGDFVAGQRVGSALLSMLGVGSSPLADDKEFWQNYKGGFALGGGMTSFINVATRTPDVIRKYNTTKYIQSQALFNRDNDQTNRAQYAAFARTAFKGNAQEAIRTIQRMRDQDLNSGSPQYTEEQWDQHIKNAMVTSMAVNNVKLNQKLLAKGIQLGTDEHYSAVADYVQNTLNRDANREETIQIASKQNELYNSKEFDDDISEQVRIDNQETGFGDIIRQIGEEAQESDMSEVLRTLDQQSKAKKHTSKKNRAIAEQSAFELEQLLEQEMDATDEDRSYEQEQAEKRGEEIVENSFGQKANLKALTILTARLNGLLKLRSIKNATDGYFDTLRNQFNIKIARPDIKTIAKSIDNQIADTKQQLSQLTGIDLNKEDGQLLEDLKQVGANQKWADALEQGERHLALLEADRKVTDSYFDTFNENIEEVKDDKGNVINYKYTGTNNKYKKYIDKIIAAKERSKNLQWAIDDVLSGNDPVVVEAQASTQPTLDGKKLPYEAPSTYIGNISTQGDLMATTSAQQASIKALAVEASKQGKYSYQQFLDDVKDNFSTKLIDQAKNQLKQLYVAAQLDENAIVDNFDTLEQVANFTEGIPTTDANIIPATTSDITSIIEANKKIIQEVSGMFDIFVDGENGVEIYTNNTIFDNPQYTPNQATNVYDEVRGILNDAITIKDLNSTIENIEQRYSVDLSKFSTYLNVPGIRDAIARSVVEQFVIQQMTSYEKGRIARQAILDVFNGNKIAEEDKAKIDNFEQFYKGVKALKKRFNKAGLSVVTVPQTIYGTDRFGNRICAEADLILKDQNGNIYIYDIYNSAKDLKDTIDNTIGTLNAYRNYTDRDKEIDALQQLGDILINQSGITIAGIGVIPVTTPGYEVNGEFNLQEPIALAGTWINNSQPGQSQIKQLQEKHDNLLNQFNQLSSKLQEQNEALIQANLEPYEALKYTQGTLNSAVELQAGISQLNSLIDDLTAIIEQQEEKLGKAHTEDRFEPVVEESIDHELMPDDVDIKLSQLSEFCRNLDQVLSSIPDTHIVSDEDRLQIEKLINSIVSVQQIINEVICDPEFNSTSIDSEMQLVTRAIEKLYYNKDNWNIPAIQPIINWWATQIVTAGGNLNYNVNSTLVLQTTSISQILANYVNQLGLWNKVITSQFIEDLADYPQLQNLYGDLLQNYLRKLLDNATLIANANPNETASGIINGLIGTDEHPGLRHQINEFFNKYSNALPISSVSAGTQISEEAERLNNLNVVNTVHSQKQSVHNPVVKRMEGNDETGRLYREISIAPDFNPNTGASLVMDNGIPKLKLVYHDKTCLIPIFVQPEANDQFERKVREMTEYVKAHPEYEIAVDIFRNNPGYARFEGNDVYKHSLTEGMISEDDVWTIGFNQESNIGVLTITSTPSSTVMSVKTGTALSTPLCVLSSRRQNIAIGNLIFVKHDTQVEKSEDIPTPLPLNVFSFNESVNTVNDGMNILKNTLDLLKMFQNGQTEITKNGVRFYVRDLIRMVLHLKENNKRKNKYEDLRHVVAVIDGTVQLGENGIGGIFNLNDASDYQKALDTFKDINFAINLDVIDERLNTSDFSVFRAMRNDFVNSDGKTWEFELPNGLKFNSEDISHKNSNGTNGIGYLGYLIKNKFITTGFTGERAYANINIGDPKLRLKGTTVSQKDTRAELNNNLDQKKNASDLLRKLSGILHKEESTSKAKRMTKEQEESAIQYLKQVFGEDFANTVKQTMSDTYIERLASDAAVLGRCTTESIELSRYTVPGVQYHEAFHRVAELLLPDKVRNSLYSWYRKNNGANLDERQVAEGIADMYMDFKNGLDEALNGIDSKYSIIKTFRKIAATVKYLSETGINRIAVIGALMRLGVPRLLRVTDQRKERFEKLFGSLNYQLTNYDTKETAQLKTITSSAQVDAIVKGLTMMLLESQNISITNLGEDLGKFKIDGTSLSLIPKDVVDMYCSDENNIFAPVFREIFKSETRLGTSENGKPFNYKYYPNFAAFTKRISEYLDTFTKGARLYTAEEQAEEIEGSDETTSPDIGQYIKQSYETSRLSTATEKVKFFFGTIPYVKWSQDGKSIVYDYNKNMFGMPQFMSINEVFGNLVQKFNDVETTYDLDRRLAKAAEDDATIRYIYNKFHKLYTDQFGVDETGNMKVNYDAEAAVTQIFGLIKSQHIDFQIATSKFENGGQTITVKSSSYDIDSSRFTRDWSKALATGTTGIVERFKSADGKYILKPQFAGKNGKDIFSTVGFMLQHLQQQINSGKNKINYDFTNNANINNPGDIQHIKDHILKLFNSIGILLNKDGLNYMLTHQYGSSDINGIRKWLNDNGNETASFGKFLSFLSGIVDKTTGQLTDEAQANFDNIYKIREKTDKAGNVSRTGGSGFVLNLAINQAAANRTSKQLMVMATQNNKYYTISQNNTVSDIKDILNRNNQNDPEIQRLLGFNYNIREVNSVKRGSIILKRLSEGSLYLDLKTFAGFKSDNNNDLGSDYYMINETEDYISKMAILLDDGVLFPTMSDKKTYLFLKGITLPGLSYSQSIQAIASKLPVYSQTGVQQSDEVLDQFIEYAECELAAIEQCIDDLKTIPEKDKVENYHTNNQYKDKTVEPNGTRFSSLTSIIDADGNTIILNDPTKSSEECVRLAKEKFFDLDVNEKRRIIARNLQLHTDLELQKCVDLGLIERVSDSGTLSYKNIALDNIRITKLKQAIQHKYKKITDQAAESLAIVTLLADVNSKSIMSLQEVERVFSGHPAFYAWYYGENSKGQPCLTDRFVDQQKRLGGLISTGNNNRVDIMHIKLYRNGKLTVIPQGENKAYNCAQIKDAKHKSTDDIIGELQHRLYINELQDIAHSIQDNSYEITDIKELENIIGDEKRVTACKRRANEAFSTYADNNAKIADGSAYITDAMAETMLRQLGLYSSKVKEAFDILRGEDKYSHKSKADAYKTVFNAVLGSQKYSAFGHRSGYNGVVTPYYDKFALFPLFDSIAFGGMHDLYNKMKNESVDMLMMDSAVKIGIQGSVKEADALDKPFNLYKQEFRFIRKQLNTDPNDKEEMSIGTQMLKVALYNVVSDKNYVFQDGKVANGREVLDNIMQAIDSLSYIGEQKFMSKLQDENGNIDVYKLSEFLKSELAARNANKNLIESIDVKETPTGPKLIMPLEASNKTWIQSILASKINKAVVDVNMPGSAFIQRSVFKMEGSNSDVDAGVIKADDGTLYNGKELQLINDKNCMDAVISIDYFEHIIPKNLKTFDEQKQWLIDNNIIGENANANTIGYRIPTQAESSINALRFVDVLPDIRDTIILPKQFVTLTGSDFKQILKSLNFFNCWETLTY